MSGQAAQTSSLSTYALFRYQSRIGLITLKVDTWSISADRSRIERLHARCRLIVEKQTQNIWPRVMSNRVESRFSNRNGAQIDVGIKNAFFMFAQRLTQRRAIRAINHREATALLQQVTFIRGVDENVQHVFRYDRACRNYEALALKSIDLGSRAVNLSAQLIAVGAVR